MKLSVSILSFKNDDSINKNIEKLNACLIDYIHLDIMDGNFVPNKTWTIDEVRKISTLKSSKLDVHLMVEDVKKYVNEFASINPQYITFHYEAVKNPMEIITLIKSYNIKVGISIKPETDVNCLLPFLDFIDLVLVMSVNPGFGGQQFLLSSKQKIDSLLELRNQNNYKYIIEVDGGINDETIEYCHNCDMVVVGSYITKNSNYEENIKSLKLKE